MASSWSSASPEPDHDPDFEDVPEKAHSIDLPTERLAMVSIVAGISGFFLPIVGPVTAIVSGHVARDEIRKSKGRLGGDGLARTGMVLGYVWIGLTLAVVSAMACFTVVMIRQDPDPIQIRASDAVTSQESWSPRYQAELPSPIVVNEFESAHTPPTATIRFLSPSKVAGALEMQKALELYRVRPSLPNLPIPPAEPDAS